MVRPLARQAGGVISFTEVDYHHDDIRDEKGRIAAFRRTIPILFCHGPWHSSWAWDSTQQRLASAGFGMCCVFSGTGVRARVRRDAFPAPCS